MFKKKGILALLILVISVATIFSLAGCASQKIDEATYNNALSQESLNKIEDYTYATILTETDVSTADGKTTKKVVTTTHVYKFDKESNLATYNVIVETMTSVKEGKKEKTTNTKELKEYYFDYTNNKVYKYDSKKKTCSETTEIEIFGSEVNKENMYNDVKDIQFTTLEYRTGKYVTPKESKNFLVEMAFKKEQVYYYVITDIKEQLDSKEQVIGGYRTKSVFERIDHEIELPKM